MWEGSGRGLGWEGGASNTPSWWGIREIFAFILMPGLLWGLEA